MKFQASHETLLPAVTLASRYVGKHANLPALAAVFIVAETDTVTLRATNLECGIEVVVPATVVEPGSVAVAGSVLAGFLQNARNATVSFATEADVVRLEAGRSKASIKTISGDEFPVLPRVSAEQSFTVQAADLVRLLRSVVGCASVSAVKPELQGVCIGGEAGKLVAAATDSFRLAEKTITLVSRGGVPPLLFPARNAAELIRLLEGREEEVEVRYSTNQLSVQLPGAYYTSRLIDGAFPNYRQIIPKEFVVEAVLLREDYSQALRSLQLFTDKFLQVSLMLDPARGVAEFSSHNTDVGEQVVTLKAAVTGTEIKMNFNSRYLADAVVPLLGESIRLRIQGAGKPLVVTAADDDSYLYLAMPMNR